MIRLEIIKEYVASLKEDCELDFIFPILLERMGFRILSTPKHSKGQSQFGRDVVATKKVKGIDTLFLFELKGFRAQDITDRTLTEKDGIIDSLKASKYTKYRDASIPGLSKYARKYVFVHNGGVDANALLTWNDFVKKEFPKNNLERWDLVKLTDLFAKYLFDETLLADEESYRLFKKVLVLLDAEGNDYSDFVALIDLQISKIETKKNNHRAVLNFFATLRLIASMVEFYAKDADNLFPAKKSIDIIVLKTWAWILKGKRERSPKIIKLFNSLVLLQMKIYEQYVNKVLRFVNMPKGLYGFQPFDTEHIFYPLRCYDFIGDLVYYYTLTESYVQISQTVVRKRMDSLKAIIRNNNVCTLPLLDTHSIPILILFKYMWFHCQSVDDQECVCNYLIDTVINLSRRYSDKKMWPEMSGNRMALAKSIYKKSDEYNCDSSLLLVVIFELIAYLNLSLLYTSFREVVVESGVNLQVAYPNCEEVDIEQSLFEHRLNEEVSVATNLTLPDTLEVFKNTFRKKFHSIDYRTDSVHYGFLRVLAHKHFETDLFPDFLGRGFCQ